MFYLKSWSAVQDKLHEFESVLGETLDALGPLEDIDQYDQEPKPHDHISQTKEEL